MCVCVCLRLLERGGLSNLIGQLLHAVKSAAGLEPTDLQIVERMVQLNPFHLIAVLDFAVDGLAGRQAVQIQQRNLACRLNL